MNSEFDGHDDVWKKASGRGKPGPELLVPRGLPSTCEGHKYRGKMPCEY